MGICLFLGRYTFSIDVFQNEFSKIICIGKSEKPVNQVVRVLSDNAF